MFLHLGSDFLINVKDIIGIFDFEQTTVCEKTKIFLNVSEKNGIIISVDDDIPKSFIVSTFYGEPRIYFSSLSSATLKKRIENSVIFAEE